MPLSQRIVVDPEVLAGKPVIRGTRLAVELILELLAAGQSENDLLTSYPGLTRDDILACLSYASYLYLNFECRSGKRRDASCARHASVPSA